jgi:GxxExxY protein
MTLSKSKLPQVEPFFEEELTSKVIGAIIEVHNNLGPGLLESAYQSCLAYELHDRNIRFVKEVEIPLVYKGIKIQCGYRADFLVEDKVLLELKSVDKLIPLHEAQLLSYLKLSRVKVGLLVNFNCLLIKHSIKRRVL